MKTENDARAHAVLGQKHAFAAASLLLGIASYVHLLGMEKALLAVVFGWLALRSSPAPALVARRLWGKIGIALGVVMLVLVPVTLCVWWDKAKAVVTALEGLQ